MILDNGTKLSGGTPQPAGSRVVCRARRRMAGWLMVTLTLGLPALASAQPGEHIRAGEAIITPKISLGLEHSTNVYHSEEAVQGGTNLRFAPGLEIGASGPDVEFAFSGEYELRKFFQSELTNLDRFNDFQVGADLLVLKDAPLGFTINELVGLRNYPAESEFAQRPFETQFRQHLNGAANIRPSGSIEMHLGGMWAFDDFQVVSGGTAGGERSFNRKNTFGPIFGAEWKFFPRTAIVVEGGYEMVRWDQNLIEGIASDEVTDFGGDLAIPDANNLRLLAGLEGRVTERVIVRLMAGYGSASYLEDTVPQDVVEGFATDLTGLQRLLVDTQFRYETSEDNRFIVGYQKNFRDVFFTNFAAYNYAYGRLESRFNPRFGFNGEFGGRFEEYEGEVQRNDIYLVGRGDVAYFLQDWANISAGVWWTQRASNDSQVEYDDVNIHLLTNIVY